MEGVTWTQFLISSSGTFMKINQRRRFEGVKPMNCFEQNNSFYNNLPLSFSRLPYLFLSLSLFLKFEKAHQSSCLAELFFTLNQHGTGILVLY